MGLYRKYSVELWIVLLPILILVGLRLLGFDGMVGQDSYAYVDYGNEIKQSIINLKHPGDFRWPEGYSLLGALLSFLGLSVGLSLQLISSLSLSFSLLFVNKIIKELYPNVEPKTIFIYLILFGILAPYYLRNGMLTMSDILACCLIIMALYYGVRYSVSKQLKHLVYFVIAASYSAFVRYPTVLVLLPVSLYVLYKWIKEIRKPQHLLVLIIPFGVFLLHHYFEQNSVAFLKHEAIVNWSFSNYFSSTFHTNQGTFNYLLPNIVYVFYPIAHYGFILLGILFVLWGIKDKQINHLYIQLCIWGYLTYALFMAGIDTQNPRHLLLLHPLVLIICFYGFNKTYHFSLIHKFRKVLNPLVFVFQLLIVIMAFKTIFLRNQLEQDILEKISSYEGQTLYSFDIDIALKSRGANFVFHNLWEKDYSSFEKNSLILFNEERTKKQWKGENPMINWNRLKNDYHLREVEQFKNNWKLYRIE